jgi:hypothetical protein
VSSVSTVTRSLITVTSFKSRVPGIVLLTRVGVINASKDLVDVVLIHHFEELVVIGIININAHTIPKLPTL